MALSTVSELRGVGAGPQAMRSMAWGANIAAPVGPQTARSGFANGEMEANADKLPHRAFLV